MYDDDADDEYDDVDDDYVVPSLGSRIRSFISNVRNDYECEHCGSHRVYFDDALDDNYCMACGSRTGT
jgi:ribosomal protein S27E